MRKETWLSKHTANMIDLFVMAIWGALTIIIVMKFFYFLAGEKQSDFSGILGVYSGVTAMAMTVINFHRGSSKSSEEKTKMMSTMSNSPNTLTNGNEPATT